MHLIAKPLLVYCGTGGRRTGPGTCVPRTWVQHLVNCEQTEVVKTMFASESGSCPQMDTDGLYIDPCVRKVVSDSKFSDETFEQMLTYRR